MRIMKVAVHTFIRRTQQYIRSLKNRQGEHKMKKEIFFFDFLKFDLQSGECMTIHVRNVFEALYCVNLMNRNSDVFGCFIINHETEIVPVTAVEEHMDKMAEQLVRYGQGVFPILEKLQVIMEYKDGILTLTFAADGVMEKPFFEKAVEKRDLAYILACQTCELAKRDDFNKKIKLSIDTWNSTDFDINEVVTTKLNDIV